MKYANVCIEAISHILPEKVVKSEAIERWLKPLYERLGFQEGRLELMTGIRERRFWPRQFNPSEAGFLAGKKVLEAAMFLPRQIECLLNCSVSRDFEEPATATVVHQKLNLPGTAFNFDISNACLGVLTGMIMLANMIELEQIKCGMIVAGEHSRPLVEDTVQLLNSDLTLTRKTVKNSFASLTIGSAATAVIMTHRDISKTGARFLGATTSSDTRFNNLCQGGTTGGVAGVHMETDAERLLKEGINLAKINWDKFKAEFGWNEATPDLLCTHQVGRAHSRLLFEQLGLDERKSVNTFDFMGNCGSASLTSTLSHAIEQGRVSAGDRIALLGIGSGINCAMAAVEWGNKQNS